MQDIEMIQTDADVKPTAIRTMVMKEIPAHPAERPSAKTNSTLTSKGKKGWIPSGIN